MTSGLFGLTPSFSGKVFEEQHRLGSLRVWGKHQIRDQVGYRTRRAGL
jgi:hypothetical protein